MGNTDGKVLRLREEEAHLFDVVPCFYEIPLHSRFFWVTGSRLVLIRLKLFSVKNIDFIALFLGVSRTVNIPYVVDFIISRVLLVVF